MPLYYAYALLVLFYVLLILEFFVPSGGLVGFAAVAVLISGLVIAFTHSLAAGMFLLLIVIATTPLVFMGVIYVWPHTPIGRRILNRRPGQSSDVVGSRVLQDGSSLASLVGRRGIARTDLLPSGLVSIESMRFDAISLGMVIDKGTPVIVTKVQAGKVHVRPVTEEETIESDIEAATDPTAQSPASLESSPELFDVESIDIEKEE